MVNSRDIGFSKEKEAVRFLKKLGYKIIKTNYSTVYGEVDIIAGHKKDIVFVEVKYRKTAECGAPHEAVNKTKQQKIIKSAIMYVKEYKIKRNLRFDVISITGDKIELIESAFCAKGYFI